ncbi:substrate-binding protein [Haloarcula sp. S1AR25-5A]|uniref:Substrate-binding protein n=1 Tax=Haloarcula terrestris TaxID=2950533 RepID=A0AAE4EU04_9EURY|nr:substrate-binding protein [Haloarcula terrestris]MDS0220180.1 substrate-binding protein [Haloarcula terrestris]
MRLESGGETVDRRSVLQVAGGVGTLGLAGLAGCQGGGSRTENTPEHPPLGNYPVDGDTVTLGFNVPQSGPYAAEGRDELRGYELAVSHLNEGGGWVGQGSFDMLSGDGILGKTVESITMDTKTKPEVATANAEEMIEQDDVVMFSGGSSSSVAIAQQEVAQAEKVPYMCCLTHSNDTTGADCVRYSFREMFNAYMTAQALRPVLTERFGQDTQYVQIYADYTWGETMEASIRDFFTANGWIELTSIATRLGTTDYEVPLEQARDAGAEVVFLNHYGLDAANSLTTAQEILPDEVEIVVPLYNRIVARNASKALDGVVGTVAWDTSISSDRSNDFKNAFTAEYGNEQQPSGVAHLAYAQTLQYAAAVERAGTFYPPTVIRELEDHDYSVGLGSQTMRACDHQAQRGVPVVEGLPESEQSRGRFYDLLNVTNAVGYECDSGPATECDLGAYGD